MKILILCTGNSCRSQMAHGFLQSFDKHLQVFSAGTKPTLQVNPIAIKVMQEIGVDISHNTPKNVELYLNDTWDYVITVCGEAKEICPTFIGKVKKQIHIGFEDPSEVKGTNEFILSEYRRVRDEIKQVFWEFYNNLK
ncbi:MAG: protein tyrosine phosphatase [Bacteroidales bacterium 36-12]|nr:MAG: protein tyrosine phosphatase [Bacteroidales bacterium 36-12]